MKSWALCLTLLAGSQTVIADNVYRWVDETGGVTYSDLAPPPSVTTAEQRRFTDRPGDQQLPYALQIATREFPVTLYSSDCGALCTQAAQLLEARGIPYSHKNPQTQQIATELMSLTGGKMEVPVLTVGTRVIKGFVDSTWHSALDVAGYPKSNQLPRNVAAKRPTESKPAEAQKDAERGDPAN
jgi:hypothetical protein